MDVDVSRRRVPILGVRGPARWAVAALAGLLLLGGTGGRSAGAAEGAGVLTWGSNVSGELATWKHTFSRHEPGLADVPDDVITIAAGYWHNIAVRPDGAVVGWGSDGSGQIGSGHPVTGVTEPSKYVAVPVTGLGSGSGVIEVAGGAEFSLALRADGRVSSSGRDGANAQRYVHTPVAGLGPGSGTIAVAAGASHSLALRQDGTVVAWGSDANGQLGDSIALVNQMVPVPVSGLSGVVTVAAGFGHSLALRGDGAVLSWGADGAGQLGNGPGGHMPVPGPVSGLGPGSGVVAIAAGRDHSLALRADGSVVAWGQDVAGQLGDGPNLTGSDGSKAAPVPVSGLGAGSGIVAVNTKGDHTLALRHDGSVLAWGDNFYGQVGVPRPDDQFSPVSGLGAGSGVVSLAAGGGHSVALKGGEQQGYAMVGADGSMSRFGNARFWGSMLGKPLSRPIVGMGYTPSGNGYWQVASDGGVFGFGDFRFYGSTGGIRLNQPVVGMELTPSGNGYWLVAADGGIFGFGDAKFFGSTGSTRLNKPVVGMERTPTGNGYWLVASDGGIFGFGDAQFFGSTGSITLNRPVVGMSRRKSGNGYLLVASDGGIFGFGDAAFHGSTGGVPLRAPIVGIMPTPSGGGYWMCARDGGIFGFGDGRFWGSLGSLPVMQPIVGCDAPHRP